MSTSARWEPVKPPVPPSGSLYRLKSLLFDEWDQGYGSECVVTPGSLSHGKLLGLQAALPEGDDRDEVGRILAALGEHGGVRVWIA